MIVAADDRLALCRPKAPAARLLDVPLDRRVSIAALVLFVASGRPALLAAAGGEHTIEPSIVSSIRLASLWQRTCGAAAPARSACPPGWVTNDDFLAGYGAAQSVPGPLFTFAAYLGAMMKLPPNGWLGGLICLIAIFLPSFLLIVGTLPFWNELRQRAAIQAALKGINAAVVGLLLAALYTPVWTSAIKGSSRFCSRPFGVSAAGILENPPWLIVILGALASAGVAQFAIARS